MPIKKNVIEEQSINDNNYKALKKLFPHAVSIDENGKYVIDSQKLQLSLDPSLADIKEDGYGLNWVGKKEAYHKAFTKNTKVLKPLEEQSKNWNDTGNILIKGDNLDALKILRQNYFEAIKMIYIDPPYNTKNDGFVYNDNFTSNTEQTLEELGYDKEYVDYIENIQGAKTHSGWLSFMYPRLLLAKDLLKEDGVIFISIDDNEVAQLRLLCDEVFGEENFITEFIWQKKKGGGNDSRYVAIEHEYILMISKNKNLLPNLIQSYSDDYAKRYNLEDKNGKYFWDTFKRKSGKQYYPITCPDGTILEYDENGNALSWLRSEKRFYSDLKNEEIKFERNNDKWSIFFKQRMPLGKTPRSLLSDYGTTSDGSSLLLEIFKKDLFQNPKPLKLLKFFIEISSNSNDIILDFFSGSGTTAHAVMDLNAKDNGNRKFILVQWAEKTPEKSEAKKAGYESIFDITKERIDRAGKAISPQNNGVDTGFRTFEIVEDSKQKIYQINLNDMTQDDLFSFSETNSIESPNEILYNLLVAESLPLSATIEELSDKKLYLCENVAFILGAMPITELIDKLKEHKQVEYVSVYSPLVEDDKFSLELESALEQVGVKGDKLRFRG